MGGEVPALPGHYVDRVGGHHHDSAIQSKRGVGARKLAQLNGIRLTDWKPKLI